MKIKASISLLLTTLLLFQPPGARGQEVDQALSQAYLESIARFAAKYTDAARNRNHEAVLQLSCLQLGIATQYIDPDAYQDGAKKSEIIALRDRSVQLHRELRDQGYCQ